MIYLEILRLSGCQRMVWYKLLNVYPDFMKL